VFLTCSGGPAGIFRRFPWTTLRQVYRALEILRNYAALTDPDIDAALAYAAELTREGTVDLPLEIKA